MPNSRLLIERAKQLQLKNNNLKSVEAMCLAIKEITGAEVVKPDIKRARTIKKYSHAVSDDIKQTTTAHNGNKQPVPEHIRRNCERVRNAEKKRKEIGYSLPGASFVSGGKVSPK